MRIMMVTLIYVVMFFALAIMACTFHVTVLNDKKVESPAMNRLRPWLPIGPCRLRPLLRQSGKTADESEGALEGVSWNLNMSFTAPLSSTTHLKLSASYLQNSGVGRTGEDLILFRRQRFEDQLKFMQSSVVEGKLIGYIVGPRGTGKSSTAYAFLSWLDSAEWDITWIGLDRSTNSLCVQFSGNVKRDAELSYEQVLNLLSQPTIGKKQFLVVDGLISCEMIDAEIEKAAKAWRSKNSLNRRVCFVSSMLVATKLGRVPDDEEIFTQYSWTLNEYIEACQSVDFRMTVSRALGIRDNGEFTGSMDEMLEKKFQVAGGCVRYMFSLSTDDVREIIGYAVSTVHHWYFCSVLQYLKLGWAPDMLAFLAEAQSGPVFNNIISQYPSTAEGMLETSLVSDLAVSFLKQAMDISALNLVRPMRGALSASTKGGLFASIFFVAITNFDVHFQCRNGSVIEFKKCPYEKIDPAKPISIWGPEMWLEPVSNYEEGQGYGAQAVYVNRDAKVVRFLQFTRFKTHSFKMGDCDVLLKNLDFAPESVEFCFVVPNDLLFEFTVDEGFTDVKGKHVDKVKGRGSLEKFKVAGQSYNWGCTEEERFVTVLAMI